MPRVAPAVESPSSRDRESEDSEDAVDDSDDGEKSAEEKDNDVDH